MARRKIITEGSAPGKQRAARKPKMPYATTPEGRENQLISAAYDLAEKQLLDGSASSQTVNHFLKLGSTREKLEQKKIEQENLLISAKLDAYASGKRIEELYESALNAMRHYSGQDVHEVDYYDRD